MLALGASLRTELAAIRAELPSLFGGWALLREWGRVGSPGQMHTMGYPDEAAATEAMTRLERGKRRRGYA